MTQHLLPNCFKNIEVWYLFVAEHSQFIGTKAGKVVDSSVLFQFNTCIILLA